MKLGDKIALWGLALALVTGFITFAAWWFPHNDDQQTTSQRQNPVTTTTTANNIITGSTTPAGGSASQTQEPAPAGDAPVAPRTGKITLTSTNSVILDSQSLNWDVHWGCGTCDLWLQGDLSAGYGGALAPLDGDEEGVYLTCAGATGYQHSISPRSIKPGLRICVKTTNANFALVTISKVVLESNSVNSITANVTSWIEH
jgi:hypothetical protein